jgi:hypothetical protein
MELGMVFHPMEFGALQMDMGFETVLPLEMVCVPMEVPRKMGLETVLLMVCFPMEVPTELGLEMEILVLPIC